MDKSRFVRRDRLTKEKRHDTYKRRMKWPEPTVCQRCRAVFQDGRWCWKESTGKAHQVSCPACQRIADNCPAGYVLISGIFFEEHREEVMNLVRNEEKLEKAEHPMERIMSMTDQDGRSLVTTTGIHMAWRIGKALSHAYQGSFSFQYGEDEKSIRVYWSR